MADKVLTVKMTGTTSAINVYRYDKLNDRSLSRSKSPTKNSHATSAGWNQDHCTLRVDSRVSFGLYVCLRCGV